MAFCAALNWGDFLDDNGYRSEAGGATQYQLLLEYPIISEVSEMMILEGMRAYKEVERTVYASHDRSLHLLFC